MSELKKIKKDEVIIMFEDLIKVYVDAFGFSVNKVSEGPDDRLDLHHDDLYYFGLKKQMKGSEQ